MHSVNSEVIRFCYLHVPLPIIVQLVKISILALNEAILNSKWN